MTVHVGYAGTFAPGVSHLPWKRCFKKPQPSRDMATKENDGVMCFHVHAHAKEETLVQRHLTRKKRRNSTLAHVSNERKTSSRTYVSKHVVPFVRRGRKQRHFQWSPRGKDAQNINISDNTEAIQPEEAQQAQPVIIESRPNSDETLHHHSQKRNFDRHPSSEKN